MKKGSGFDGYLTKPFLPTDLMELLEKLPETENEAQTAQEDVDIESLGGLSDLDVGSFADEDISGDDELESLDGDEDFDMQEETMQNRQSDNNNVYDDGESSHDDEIEDINIEDMFEDLEDEGLETETLTDTDKKTVLK